MAKIVIYSTNRCPYCVAAKQLLKTKGLEYEEIDVSDSDELRQKIQELSGQRTVPQIFIDDKSIGGYQELNALNHSGELDKLTS